MYISYDGILEPISESQILPQIYHLSDDNKIILITFEKIENINNHDFKRKVKKKIKQHPACASRSRGGKTLD